MYSIIWYIMFMYIYTYMNEGEVGTRSKCCFKLNLDSILDSKL